MSRRRTAKKNRRRGFFYAKAFAGVLSTLCMIISMAIPCLRYTTADGGTNAPIAGWTLIRNSWGQVRAYLFGNPKDVTTASTSFSWATLITVAVTVFLFALSTALTVWFAIGAVRALSGKSKEGNERALFQTVFPNRFVLCLYRLLALPLLAFPRFLVLLYGDLLIYPVLLNVTFPEPLLIGGVLLLAEILVTFACVGAERRAGMEVFAKQSKAKKQEEEEEEEDYVPLYSKKETDEITKRARDEQLARIRALFSENDPTDDEHKG